MTNEEFKRTIVCTINVQTTNQDSEEVYGIRQDLSLFLLSVGARVLVGPLEKISDPELITSTFEIMPRMQETVENYFYLTAEYPKSFESTLSFDKIEASIS